MSHTATRCFGELTPFSDKLLARCLKWCDPQSLANLSGVSRLGYVLATDNVTWKEFCLETLANNGLVKGKEAAFCFKVNWKYTYFRPEAKTSTPPTPLSSNLPSSFYKPRPTKRQLYYTRPFNLRGALRGPAIQRVKASEMSPELFFAKYDSLNTPLIIEGAVEAWGWSKFSHQDFLAEFSDRVFKTNGVTEDGRTLRMTYSQYASYCKDSWGHGEKPMYIFDNKFTQRAPEISRKYSIPQYFKEDLFDCMSSEDRPDYRWLLIGPAGSGAPFHTDPHMTHAWNVVTEGRKRISFYPPNVIPPGVDKELIYTEYYAAKDTVEWYTDIYPHLTEERLPLEGVVEAGEMVFIPSGWWHQVLNIGEGFTMAMTQNVCTKGNFNRVWYELQKRGPRSLANRFERDCKKKGYTHMFDSYKRPVDIVSESECSSSTDSDSDTSES